MVFDLETLVERYKLNIENIIHVGGHFGEEISTYKKINRECKISIFEPAPLNFRTLVEEALKYKDVTCFNVALGSETGKNNLFVETNNNGQSNSLLKPKIHLQQYPGIVFNNVVEVDVKTMDSYNFDTTYNFISLDVQGFELEVLKGARETLKHVSYIITEVNKSELYENCCMVTDLDSYLHLFGFKRVETDWIGDTWGDALYIKQ
jgi:FkbM family methyltransferase